MKCDACGKELRHEDWHGACYVSDGFNNCPARFCVPCALKVYDGIGNRLCKFHKAERVLVGGRT